MDINKEREAFEQALVNQKNVSINNLHVCTIFDAEKNKYSPSDVCDPKEDFIVDWINSSWSIWQAAKAQAVPEWISVEGKLPETEPNTDGVVCAVVCSLGNVYRARYMHDVDVGIDAKYWSEFSVGYNGVEHEHYEINAKITRWMPLPDAPQEPAND